jgi:hypothetical protein
MIMAVTVAVINIDKILVAETIVAVEETTVAAVVVETIAVAEEIIVAAEEITTTGILKNDINIQSK